MQPHNELLQPDNADITRPNTQLQITAGHLPVVQVRQDDAADEVDGPLEAWRKQTAPHSVHGAAGDGAVGGRALRRHRQQVS